MPSQCQSSVEKKSSSHFIQCVVCITHRYEDVEEVFQSGELRYELLHHSAEGLGEGVGS